MLYSSKHHLRALSLTQVQDLTPTRDEVEIIKKYRRDVPIIQIGMLVPTITASLRESLNFSDSLLKEKGLYAFLIRDESGCARWISPFESARALGYNTATMLPADPKVAQRIVGNAISPYHAALMSQYTGKVLKEKPGLAYDTTFTEILKEIDEQLGELDDLQLVNSQGGPLLCQPGEKELTSVEPVSHKHKQFSDTLIELAPTLRTQVDEPTQPFRLVLEGDAVETGSSAMIDVSGRSSPCLILPN